MYTLLHLSMTTGAWAYIIKVLHVHCIKLCVECCLPFPYRSQGLVAHKSPTVLGLWHEMCYIDNQWNIKTLIVTQYN